MNYSLTGLVVPMGDLYGNDLHEGDRKATEEEIKAHEALSLKAKIPQIITMRQARLQLLALGLLDDVEAVIGNITDVTTKKTVQIEWEYAKDVERNSPTILLLAQSVGMDEVALDNLFVEAAKL